METDVKKAVSLLNEMRHKCEDVTSHINNLVTKIEDGSLDTSKGISFLDVKYQLLLQYITDLSYVMLRKVRGDSIQGEEAIERLVEMRTVLEKIRPIDQKLKYQVDKVIRIFNIGGQDANDPMNFKANPDSLESKIESDESGSGSDSGDEEEKSSKVYKPPKLAAVHYDGDETQSSKREKQMENLRKRALNSDILQDLKDQYNEGPEEIRETRDLHRLKVDKRTKEKTRYEEEHFTRLTTTKKEKQSQQRVATISSLNNLTQFHSISALDMEEGQAADFPAKRRKVEKSKGKKGGKKGKKGFKKKRR